MTDQELDLTLQMAELIRSMSLEIWFHREHGAGEPQELARTQPYAPLAAQFDAQILLLRKYRETPAASRADEQTLASLREILKMATGIDRKSMTER